MSCNSLNMSDGLDFLLKGMSVFNMPTSVLETVTISVYEFFIPEIIHHNILNFNGISNIKHCIFVL